MTIDNIPAGSSIFLDANCLVYDVTLHPTHGPACKRLLVRIENKDLRGYTSAAVLAEASHRLMTIEVADRLSRPLAGMANWLRRHPAEIQQCKILRQALDEVAAIPLTILPVNGTHVSRAADLSIQLGLVANDALIVAVMHEHNLTDLASNDTDFDRVQGLTRYAPVRAALRAGCRYRHGFILCARVERLDS